MAGYSSYSFKAVKHKFGLVEKKVNLTNPVTLITPSEMLLQQLDRGKRRVSLNNEKSRSEFVVAPILLEVSENNATKISIYSGENMDVDRSNGLTGECDFILSKAPDSSTLEAPILCMVETENDNINTGLGQCVAQMVGAKIFNEAEQNPQPFIYGCVTTGFEWKFLKLENNIIYTDIDHHSVENVGIILGAFQQIIDKFDKPIV